MSQNVESPMLEERVLGVLKQFWGFDRLRPFQAEAIEAGTRQRDSLVVLPTGGGKSLCYQIPPVITDRTDVVVSPLISLMKDQVDGLKACGYPAVALNSSMTAGERRDAEAAVRNGACRLLFVAPERILSNWCLDLIARARIRTFAIDEAHCISHWGHDFRPEYRRLAEMRDRFPDASLHAYTATATERVRADIIQQLRLRDPAVLVGCFDRPNLVYRVIPRTDVYGQVLEAVRRHEDQAAIVYCISRRDTEGMAEYLKQAGVKAAHYHAGMEATPRRRTQEDFAAEKLDVVVATVAFGMGIDRSNVRCVIHAGLPKSIEHYQQETGRAGRDGLEAECVLFYSGGDIPKLQRMIRMSAEDAAERKVLAAASIPDSPFPDGTIPTAPFSGDLPPDAVDESEVDAWLNRDLSEERPASPTNSRDSIGERVAKRGNSAEDRRSGLTPQESRAALAAAATADQIAAQFELLEHIRRYCSTQECRHRALSEYFGQSLDQENCGACDVCLREVEGVEDATVTAQKILSCVYRVQQRFGVTHIVDVLLGTGTEKLRSLGHDRLSTYGLMKNTDRKLLTGMVHQLVDQGLLERTPGDRPVLRLNTASNEVLFKGRKVQLFRPKAGKVQETEIDLTSWEGVDKDLFESLRELRREIATDRGVQAYMIFSDATLRDLARRRPTTQTTFRQVHGVGDRKAADFGDSFIESIKTHCREHKIETDLNPPRPSRSQRPAPPRPNRSAAREQAFELFSQGLSIDDVKHTIDRARSTTMQYLAEFIAINRPASISHWIDDKTYRRIAAAAEEVGRDALRPIFERLDAQIPYDDIRLVVTHLEARSPTDSV